MKRYYTYTVKKLVTVQHLVTIEYLQVAPGFSYPEEIHDFYEFVFVESGHIVCNTGDERVLLNTHDFFLLSPNTAHSYSMETHNASSIVIVCFKSRSGMVNNVKGVHTLEPEMRTLINEILAEAKATFVFPFDKKLTLNSHPRLGSQQLIENYIEELLIKLIQEAIKQQDNVQMLADLQDVKQSIVKEIKQLLTKHIDTEITLTDISRQLLYSKTYLNNIFKEVTGMTIMQYSQSLKIQKAKKLLQKQESISVVAEKLNFENPQYFARFFKSRTGSTPSEYRRRYKDQRN